MRELLIQAGFVLRFTNHDGSGRASCIHCTGGDRQTVSYNASAAHCFRCGWKTNRILISKELGVTLTPAMRLQLGREQRQAMRTLELQKAFEEWRDKKIEDILNTLHGLRITRRHAHSILQAFPDECLAWNVLADYYHSEAGLMATADFLQCTKVSIWCEDSTMQQVVKQWRTERME